ncbi:MAG: sugar phosphate nucleotidyltransferase [Thermomicrobiales bacterium]
MDVILPVAGLGTRLRPQTWSKPKPLVSVGGKPMLAHVLDRVMQVEPDKLVFITGFLGEQIEEWATANYDLPMEFVAQPEMRGQTDAIIRTRDVVAGDALILFPDMIFEADFSDLATVDADVVMYCKEVEDPSALGVAVVENGRIVRLVEKPQEPISKLAVIGIYYFKHMPDLFGAIEEQMARGITLKNEYFIADAIQLMIDAGKKVVPAMVTAWEDCGNAEALLATNRYLLDRQSTRDDRRETAIVIQPSVIAEDATLERAVVGPYASVGPGAVIRDAIVRDSIVEEEAAIERAVIDQSIVGRRARVVGKASSINAGDLTDVRQ